MKLAIIIPAFDEAETIGPVIRQVPRSIPGISEVRITVLDDGSSDSTAEAARSAGADAVISNGRNIGLAKAFDRGLEAALMAGADIIVNLDADGQYEPAEIPALIRPILANRAGIVIGDRQVKRLGFMKAGNKYGNLAGSWALRRLTGARVNDASSGFRALSREAALRLNLFSGHTYTHEMIIQAIYKGLAVEEVPVTFRERRSGRSRLIKSLGGHVKKSSLAIIRAVLMYKPMKALFYSGLLVMAPGIVLGLRFLYNFYWLGNSAGKVQSLILAAILIIIGFYVIVLGLLGDLIAKNRKLSEDIVYLLKKREYRRQK